MEADYYSLLGVERTAEPRVITAAYRRMAMKWHPDRHPLQADKLIAEQKFKAIQQAYATLSDEEKRERYDDEASDSFFTETQSRQSTGEWEKEFHRHRSHLPKGAEIKKKVFVDIECAAGGGRIQFERLRRESCSECDGKGAYLVPCPSCNGKGVRGRHYCFDCYGRQYVRCDCDVCEGTGHVERSVPLTIRIRPGVVDGSVLIVKEAGKASRYGGPAGDLVLTIAIKASAGWKVKRSDLHGKIKINFSTAMLGGTQDIALPTGRNIAVTVPARTNSGKKLRLPGLGLYDAQNKTTGDVILEAVIVLPTSKRKLTGDMEKLLRTLDGEPLTD